jgi:hypothetical protein
MAQKPVLNDECVLPHADLLRRCGWRSRSVIRSEFSGLIGWHSEHRVELGSSSVHDAVHVRPLAIFERASR